MIMTEEQFDQHTMRMDGDELAEAFKYWQWTKKFLPLEDRTQLLIGQRVYIQHNSAELSITRPAKVLSHGSRMQFELVNTRQEEHPVVSILDGWVVLRIDCEEH